LKNVNITGILKKFCIRHLKSLPRNVEIHYRCFCSQIAFDSEIVKGQHFCSVETDSDVI